MKRIAAVFLSLLVGALVNVGTAAAVTPPSLTGEALITNAPVTVTAVCQSGDGSTISFTASGPVAAGPYPGTFTASGIVTLGAQATPGAGQFGVDAGPVTGFAETFAINSPVGVVNGTKSLNTSGGTNSPNTGSCADLQDTPIDGLGDGTIATGKIAQASFGADYHATIDTADGSFKDSGLSTGTVDHVDLALTGGPFSAFGIDTFGENFTLSNGVAPVLPTDKDQCKEGGWQTYGVFKNQGDCVSFVATGGKNPPSGA